MRLDAIYFPRGQAGPENAPGPDPAAPGRGREDRRDNPGHANEPAAELPLTSANLAAMKAAEDAIAADERFEYLAPAEDLIREFAADCAADRQTDHVRAFMERHGRTSASGSATSASSTFALARATEVAGIRLLPPDDPEIPDTNPLFKVDQSITGFAAVPVTGTNDVMMAARARKLAEHALRVLRVALRQSSHGLNPQQLRFRLGTSYAFADSGGGWQMHDDVAILSSCSSDFTPVLAAAVAGLPPTAAKKSINEKALLAVGWLDRAVFTSDPLVATLFRFFALEALLGDASDRLKNGPLALRQMTLSRIAMGASGTPTTRSWHTTRCVRSPCTAKSRRR